MFNTYRVLNPDWKTPRFPGKDIYCYKMAKLTKYRDSVEKDEFLVKTSCVIHTINIPII